MDRSVESFFEVAVIPYYEHRLQETLTDAGWRDRLGKPDAPQPRIGRRCCSSLVDVHRRLSAAASTALVA